MAFERSSVCSRNATDSHRDDPNALSRGAALRYRRLLLGAFASNPMNLCVTALNRLDQPIGRRRKKKEPGGLTLLREEWLAWLVQEYGADRVAQWDDVPDDVPSFENWLRVRRLAAHVAA